MATATKPKLVRSKEVRDLLERSQKELWWLAERKGDKDPTGKAVARAVNDAAKRREMANIPVRWRNYVYFREMTGRPSLAQFAYGMSKRPQTFVNYYSSFQFSGIKSRFAASMADVYTNRLFGHMTYISFCPDNGDYDQISQCQEMEAWVEGGFDQLNYWAARTTMGIESEYYGTGAIKFCEDSGGNPKVESKNPDELLYSNPDDTDPYDVIDRTWAKKTELIEKYKDDDAACEAIAKASTAYPAFYFGMGTMDTTDVVPYLEAYTRPLGKTPGRHVVCIGDYTITDEEWNYPHPYELFQFNTMPGSLFGQGIAEQLLQVSQWIDGILSIMQESEQRGGAGKWVYDENSNVNPDSLGDQIAAAVSYLGTKPEYITPEGIGEWSLKHLEMLMNLGRSIVHVSENAVKGEAPKSFTSGVALEKYAEIDDQTFLEKIGRLEEYDRRCAYQFLMLGERTKCDFIRRGQDRKAIKWVDIKWNPAFRLTNIQAYNVGRLSQTVAGRIQVLKEMYAEKTINKDLYIKYQQTPDINGMFSELNGPVDSIQKQLDDLVKSKDYIPPSPFMPYDLAVEMCESRMDREQSKGAPQAVIDRLSMWRAMVKSFEVQNTTPDQPAGSPVAGQQPNNAPAGQGPVPFGIQPPPDAANVAPIQPGAIAPSLPQLTTTPGGPQ
jgi:hypothetical protein